MAKVVSLGIHIADMLGRPVVEIPPGQQLALLDEIRITVAGTAAGTSVDLAKLGLDVVAMGAIGTDGLGDFIVDTMGRYKIDTTNLVRKDGIQTSATMLPIRPNGDRPALHVTGANGELTFEDINLDAIASADYLHMGGTSLLPKFDGEPTRKVLEFAKKHDVIVTFDLVAIDRPDLLDLIEPLLPYIDFFMPGLEEAEMMTGLSDRRANIEYFLDRGARHTVFKMGSAGSSIAYRENGELKEILVPIFETTVVDSTGCGDSYCAGFITGLSHGWDLDKCGLFGSACAAQVITGLGSDAGIVDFAGTVKYMEQTRKIQPTV
ncbi:MAG: sugar kinase [Spirochaeta sp.]|jgi:sugar/nucleoside kinase (ribokinase family)|nr:sugar kinase [Spirochaeta sp.]